MNKMLVAIIDVNKTLVDMNSNFGGKMDVVGNKDVLGGKMDLMLQKQDELMDELMDELIVEVKDIGQSQSEILDALKICA